MANSWTLTVIILLSIILARSQTRGDQGTVSHQNQASAIEKLTVFKEQTFFSGTNVTLRCGNVTDVKWSELIYIVWNISLQGKKCWLGLSPKMDGTCKDGKRLFNTSDGVSLFIPNISIEDEGFYSCDASYKGGSYMVNVSVSVIQLSTKQDRKNSQRIAVCQATYKKTAPTLHWEPALNYCSNISSFNNGMYVMMESRVCLSDKVNISELTCVATYTSESGSVQQKSTLHFTTGSTESKSSFQSEVIAILVAFVCLILVSLGVYFLCRKFYDISALKSFCCKSKISTPAEDKPPQPADVEEVEPYASYIQRVNSIYNSSAELFNA
ncbi:cell surface glycoprotein CD200 receptor 1-A [Garra rufa]|uniref:cell surface glycoprotein CD200 receptor 1-A n=1 Tax=Garra rufa TaxID=137080 RepID=UPI003CCE9B52